MENIIWSELEKDNQEFSSNGLGPLPSELNSTIDISRSEYKDWTAKLTDWTWLVPAAIELKKNWPTTTWLSVLTNYNSREVISKGKLFIISILKIPCEIITYSNSNSSDAWW